MIFEIYTSIGFFIFRNLFKITLILFFGFKYRGAENIPSKGAFIIAGNHASYMDPPAVGAVSRRRVYFITSDHLYKNPILGLWYTSTGCIKVKRGEPSHRTMKKILDCLKAGKPLAMFPEGTRSSDGNLQEPLAGIGFLAFKARVPVVPCFITGTEKALPRGAKFFKKAKVSVYIGKAISPDTFKFEGDKREGYRLFSKKVMKSILELKKRHGD